MMTKPNHAEGPPRVACVVSILAAMCGCVPADHARHAASQTGSSDLVAVLTLVAADTAEQKRNFSLRFRFDDEVSPIERRQLQNGLSRYGQLDQTASADDSPRGQMVIAVHRVDFMNEVATVQVFVGQRNDVATYCYELERPGGVWKVRSKRLTSIS